MSKKTLHYVIHSCGPQECDCSAVCNPREGDEIQITANASCVTCGNCLRVMAKRRVLLAPDQVARLQAPKSIGDWQEALRLLRDVVMHGEDAIDQRNGETVKAKCRKFLDRHGDAL
ncbi:hypothetical protein NDO41_16430 [Ectopseudomonas mendocina]|nr:hypothetical protein NDO41_16430 [Pseudomonas mendocina]